MGNFYAGKSCMESMPQSCSRFTVEAFLPSADIVRQVFHMQECELKAAINLDNSIEAPWIRTLYSISIGAQNLTAGRTEVPVLALGIRPGSP
jgi:hypothetical protein